MGRALPPLGADATPLLPRYPVYVPSKGRAKKMWTAEFLMNDRVPFYMVIEEDDFKSYAEIVGEDRCLVLPFKNTGSSIAARNWIKEHATTHGHDRHWQLDDNIECLRRVHKGLRVACRAGVALAVTEDFVDRYENVAVAGLNYDCFAIGLTKPFFVNVHVYSCTLVLNSIPHKWRGHYNEDTDLCLQVLSDGWCTVLMNAFVAEKKNTMTMKGGNTDKLYKGDGRLRMARSLARQWPHVVTVGRRFQRPQHYVRNAWRSFDTKLKRKAGLKLDELKPNEYGMKLHTKVDWPDQSKK